MIKQNGLLRINIENLSKGLQVCGLISCNAEGIGLKGWTSNDHVCWRCRANKGNIPYWDPKPNAKWRKKRINATEFATLVRENGCDMSPLFSLPGFTLLHICIDSLHALDLGFAQEILGNIFYECLGHLPWGETRRSNCQIPYKK